MLCVVCFLFLIGRKTTLEKERCALSVLFVFLSESVSKEFHDKLTKFILFWCPQK